MSRPRVPAEALSDWPGSALVDQYLAFARDQQGYSVSTLQGYRGYIRGLAYHAAQLGHTSLVELPLPVLAAYVAQHRSRASIQNVASAVRSFLRYLFLLGLEQQDRSRWIDSPRRYKRQRLPRHLTDEQLDQAFAQAERHTVHGKKVWAILTLLTNYGLRIGEVAQLRLDDICSQGRWLRVRRTKTGEESLYPLTPAVEEALQDYLRVRPTAPFREVFLTTQKPHRPYPKGGSLVGCVRTVLQRVGPAKGKGSHAVRHTLARRMRESGVPVPLMRRVMGHKSSLSTAAYLPICTEELREVADNYANLL